MHVQMLGDPHRRDVRMLGQCEEGDSWYLDEAAGEQLCSQHTKQRIRVLRSQVSR